MKDWWNYKYVHIDKLKKAKRLFEKEFALKEGNSKPLSEREAINTQVEECAKQLSEKEAINTPIGAMQI